MSAVDLSGRRECHDFLANTVDEGGEVAAFKVSTSHAVAEDGVASNQDVVFGGIETDAAWGMTRCGNYFEFGVAKLDDVAIVQEVFWRRHWWQGHVETAHVVNHLLSHVEDRQVVCASLRIKIEVALHIVDAPDMVEMHVSTQQMTERDAFTFNACLYVAPFAVGGATAVDDHTFFCVVVAQQVTVHAEGIDAKCLYNHNSLII